MRRKGLPSAARGAGWLCAAFADSTGVVGSGGVDGDLLVLLAPRLSVGNYHIGDFYAPQNSHNSRLQHRLSSY